MGTLGLLRWRGSLWVRLAYRLRAREEREGFSRPFHGLLSVGRTMNEAAASITHEPDECVDVTSAMASAGAHALLRYSMRDLECTDPEIIVIEVYRAMVRLAPRYPHGGLLRLQSSPTVRQILLDRAAIHFRLAGRELRRIRLAVAHLRGALVSLLDCLRNRSSRPLDLE